MRDDEYILRHIFRDVKVIKGYVKNLNLMMNSEFPKFETVDTKLNFTTYEDLYDFGLKLGDDQDFFNIMLTSLSLLGGKDSQETTRKILNTLITHELSIKINWIGVNDKGSFQKLKYVLKLIYAAVRRNPVCNNATNAEIDQSIKNWIKNAADREGGRALRKKRA